MAVTRSMRYRLSIETLTPLHIGTGEPPLRRDYDYAVHDGQTWVIEPDAVAEQFYAAGSQGAEWQGLLRGRPPAALLQPADFRRDSDLFRYVLRGEPRSQDRHAPVRELIKTPWRQPYIPGSSLKGALRTVILVTAFRQEKMPFDPEQLDGRPKFAAQPLEQALASPRAPRGKAPNYDLFRALQVNDSQPDEQRRIVLAASAVYAGQDASIPVALECVPKGVTFHARLVLDRPLLSEYGPQRLNWDPQRQVQWLGSIRSRANNLAYRRMREEEYPYWRGRSSQLESFYMQHFAELDALVKDRNARSCYLQLGWGAGWNSKTFGSLLTRDAAQFDRVVARYERELNPQRSYRPGGRFPKSRKVLVDAQNNPVSPLGWVKITWEREA